MWGEMRGREAGGRGAAAAQAACTGRARLKAGEQGMRGAHVEHVAHVRDLGRVEAQRLVERPRPLPTRKEGTYDAERGKGAGRREVAAAQAARTGWAREKGWWPRHAWSARRTWSAWL